MKSKKYIIPAIIAVTAAIAGTVYATGASASWGKGSAEMASSLASKLGVDQSKVSDALDSIQSEHQAARQAEESANLDKAVTAGVITAEQKAALIAKHDEMRQKQEALRTEMEQWYKDQGIDTSKLEEYGIRGGMGMGGRHRGGPGMGM